MEEGICEQWKQEGTFKMQDKLAKDRNDEVRRVLDNLD